MAQRIKVQFDLNIILGVLQEPELFYETSAQLLALAETGKIEGFLAPHSLTTLFYLIQKDQSASHAKLNYSYSYHDNEATGMSMSHACFPV